LIVNKRDHEIGSKLPEARGGKREVVDQTKASNPPASSTIDAPSFTLGGLAVAVATLPR
jgi:hypothetical protein